MSYIGKEPSYGVFEKQILTGDGSSTLFTLGPLVVRRWFYTSIIRWCYSRI